jgi:uncharacterized protein (DUF983 family)
MPKTSKLTAILKAKCPRCRRGNIFQGPPYALKSQVTNTNCPHCNFRYEIEPGFFYAAMFVSYALNVAEIITTALIVSYVSGGSESPLLYIGIILAVIIFLAPLNYRYSRVILLHWLTPGLKYDPSYENR